jgi:hypothetical protein
MVEMTSIISEPHVSSIQLSMLSRIGGTRLIVLAESGALVNLHGQGSWRAHRLQHHPGRRADNTTSTNQTWPLVYHRAQSISTQRISSHKRLHVALQVAVVRPQLCSAEPPPTHAAHLQRVLRVPRRHHGLLIQEPAEDEPGAGDVDKDAHGETCRGAKAHSQGQETAKPTFSSTCD